jgi:uncharacterized circularly permuted ATP-grasp superfamily protein
MPNSLKTKPAKALLDGYASENFFDEMMALDGGLRPHYSRFHELFQTLTPQ